MDVEHAPHIPHKAPAAPVKYDASLGPTKCSKSSDPSKPIIQYAIMIDAGSTGSRIHVYRFNNCGSTPELEDETFKMTEKRAGGAGLSAYGDDPDAAARSLDILMEAAVKAVPEKLRSCTPLALRATAGLRLLGPERSAKILSTVRLRLETAYPFAVVSERNHGVEIMEGRDEGVYAWITTNYLLGKIGGKDHNPTAAILDLGGGSTQIVFEPTYAQSKSGGMSEQLADGEHKYDLNFGGRHFSLYQHSHLGYGLMSAREAMHKQVIEAKHAEHPDDREWLNQPVVNPCISSAMSRDVKVKLSESHPLGPEVQVKMVGPSEGSQAQCRKLAEDILSKDAKCSLSPCSFNGVHQPSMAKTFSREDVYIFSYFYDRTNPLGMPESFTVEELSRLAEDVCQGERGWAKFGAFKGALDELRDRPETCLDLSFMFVLLHTGYEMPLSREVKTAKTIHDRELGWCLGASLPLLSRDSGWKCRVQEVKRNPVTIAM